MLSKRRLDAAKAWTDIEEAVESNEVLEGVVTEARAQENIFHVVGEYTMSDNEIKTVAQERAVQIAMADGVMQSAVYIKSFSQFCFRDNRIGHKIHNPRPPR